MVFYRDYGSDITVALASGSFFGYYKYKIPENMLELSI